MHIFYGGKAQFATGLWLNYSGYSGFWDIFVCFFMHVHFWCR